MVGLPELTAEQARTVLSLLCAMAPGGDQCEAQLRASRQNVLARFDLAGLCADGTAHLTSSGPRWPEPARRRTGREAKGEAGEDDSPVDCPPTERAPPWTAEALALKRSRMRSADGCGHRPQGEMRMAARRETGHRLRLPSVPLLAVL